jgi:putative transposase
MIRAIEECFPRSPRQPCLVHKLRSLQSKMPEDEWPEFRARDRLLPAASPALARLLRDDIAATLPSTVASFPYDFEACIAHL